MQIGSICTGGTTCGNDRNLLDFNDLQIDSEGRVLAAYADGCVAPACTAATADNPPDPANGYTASRSALSSIIRQSGGPRLLAAYDPNPAEPTVPLAPRVDSVIGAAGSVVHLDWSEPDNGGAPLTGYNVYRRTSVGTYSTPLATVTLGCPACKSDYDDTTTVAGTSYFYKVTALNAQGESMNCGEFPIGMATGVVERACLLPGLTILTDPANDELDMLPGHDVQRLQIAEPAAFAPNKVVFTLKMQSLTTVPPDTEWPITFTFNGTNYTVRMTNSPVDGATTMPIFQVGPTAGPFVAADPASAFLPDGTITIVVPRSAIGNPANAQQLTGFLVRIAANLIGITITPDNMPDNLGPAGTYTLAGNLPCNTAPVAALSANPLSGDPPLVVNFNASASTDPDPGDSVVSYTFDFGDLSPQVTQAGPTISHTYNSNGHYHATVSVTDSHGLASSNIAGVEIEVELPLDDIVSRKVHGSFVGDIDLLKPDGTGDTECRSGGTTKTATIIYTFDPAFAPTGMANNVTLSPVSGATINDHEAGPNTNQYTVHLKNVANAQHLFVTLNGLPVHNNNTNTNATLNAVQARLDVILGDTSNNGAVNATDVSTTKPLSGSAAGASNFRNDVNVNGVVNSTDVSIVKIQSGTALPPTAPPAAPTQTRRSQLKSR